MVAKPEDHRLILAVPQSSDADDGTQVRLGVGLCDDDPKVRRSYPAWAGMRNVSPQSIYAGCSIASVAASDSNSASTAATSFSVLLPARRMSLY